MAAAAHDGLLLEPSQQAPVPLAGGWQYHTVPEAMGYPPRAPWESVAGLSSIYNAMIAPLARLRLRGVLWYQGESNTADAAGYGPLLRALFQDWRAPFQDANLPFLVEQLPNFGLPAFAPAESAWATLREAQRRTVRTDRRAALAVTIDVGEPQGLHPPNKQAVGVWLARAAQHLIYGDPASASGPAAVSVHRERDEAVIDFADIEGTLRTQSGTSALGFELCGAQPGNCRHRDGHMAGQRVELAVGGVPVTRVRYCWADAPLCNLYDASGLPAAPFELEISRP